MEISVCSLLQRGPWARATLAGECCVVEKDGRHNVFELLRMTPFSRLLWAQLGYHGNFGDCDWRGDAHKHQKEDASGPDQNYILSCVRPSHTFAASFIGMFHSFFGLLCFIIGLNLGLGMDSIIFNILGTFNLFTKSGPLDPLFII